MLRLARSTRGEGPEVFRSIQGEGVTAGRPSTFVRLALCNLSCGWCDTKYTWDWAHYDPRQEIVTASAEAVAARIEELGADNVVITGGEPLLQQEELCSLAALLAGAGARIEVETNGTIVPEDVFAAFVTQWNVSPKLSHSENTQAVREVPAALHWFAEASDAWFKFVVREPTDIAELAELVQRHQLPRERTILMPEGTTPEALRARSGWLAERCADEGFRFSTRLHVLLWGDERGR